MNLNPPNDRTSGQPAAPRSRHPGLACQTRRTPSTGPAGAHAGFILLLVMIMLTISLLTVAAVYSYTISTELNNQRNNDYSVAVSAAEAATEKVVAQVSSDFMNKGIAYVAAHTSSYSQMVPLASEASVWTNFSFMDMAGNAGATSLQYSNLSGFPQINGYAPLRGFIDQVRIVSNARANNNLSGVVGSVYQDIQLAQIPIFQYAIFYNVTLEFTPEPPMTIWGPIQCNTNIYLNPMGTLTFLNNISSSGNIIQGPNPASPTMPNLGGTVVFDGTHVSDISTLSLPVGTNNTPAAVQQVIQIPPVGEDPASAMGQQRYYNKADLIILVNNNGIVAESGLASSFAQQVPTNELALFVSTNMSFYNKRETKTVKAIQIDVGALTLWNATNKSFSPALASKNVETIFVADLRTLPSADEPGIRLVNGATLPPLGLTVATPDPLYIQGNYNVPASALGTTNTTGALPASIASDAITILSTTWNDTNSTLNLSSRIAGNTTVNAAFLTGIVASSASSDSGGVENFPRYLEDWSNATNTYNGSMICMYYSHIATGPWLGIGSTYNIYNPPTRNWSLDQNFQYQNKLPPGTPCLAVVFRQDWHIPAAFTMNIVTCF
jgi:hypothetical protein